MLVNLVNASNNAYDRSLKKYLRPQDNTKSQKMVDGKWVEFTPNRPYYAESKDVIAAANILKRHSPTMARDIARYPLSVQLKAQEVVLKGGPKLIEPVAAYDNIDKTFRGPVLPTSSAIGKMSYNPKTHRVTFAFRNGSKKGYGKTYSALMNSQQLFNWMSSGSIGKYFNKRLKSRMTPYA